MQPPLFLVFERARSISGRNRWILNLGKGDERGAENHLFLSVFAGFSLILMGKKTPIFI
jgi:hypothetical protein